VYLVGFMGAGKTTLARALGARLGWRAEDVDERIEAREHRTIAEVFARDGEPYFRSVERQVLLDLLPLRHTVVATGGGTFADLENRALINRDGLSIWIGSQNGKPRPQWAEGLAEDELEIADDCRAPTIHEAGHRHRRRIGELTAQLWQERAAT